MLSDFPAQISKRLAPVALLFRPPFLARAAAGTHVRMLTEIMGAAGVPADRLQRPLCAVLDELYGMLVEHYRCEYVFKNAIATNILMDFHSPEKARLLSEFSLSTQKTSARIRSRCWCRPVSGRAPAITGQILKAGQVLHASPLHDAALSC